MRKIERSAVYVVKMAGDDKYASLALDAHMHTNGDLRYWDTIHPHQLVGELKEVTDDGFIFTMVDYRPGDWHFKILTIEDFRRTYYKLVQGGEAMAAKIRTTDDLHFWYRTNYVNF